MADGSIVQVAKTQRWLLFIILFHILFNIAYVVFVAKGDPKNPSGLALVIQILALPLLIATLVALVMLMNAMKRPLVSVVLAAIAMFIPLVNLIVLLVVNQRATGTLKAAGYKVGLMGAKA